MARDNRGRKRAVDLHCLFCGVPLQSGAFCPQCIAVKKTALASLTKRAIEYQDPEFGPLVLRNGPKSVLIRQPPEGTWES